MKLTAFAWLSLALLGLAPPGSSLAAQDAKEERSFDDSAKTFAEALLKLLREKPGGGEFEYDAEENQLLGSGGMRVSLVNMHATFLAMPAGERADYLDRIADLLGGDAEVATPALDDVVDWLVPKVWLRAPYDSMALEQFGLGSTAESLMVTLPEWQLGEHMAAFLAIDRPTSTVAVTQDMLEDWGVRPAQLCAQAIQNLGRIGSNWKMALSESNKDARLMIPVDGQDLTYLTSQLLTLPTSQSGAQEGGVQPLPEGTLAAAPSRESLMICVPGDAELEGVFFEWAASDRKLPYPQDAMPLELRGGRWVSWVPPAGHPQEVALLNRRRLLLGQLYADQKAAIERLQGTLEGDESTGDVPIEKIPLEFVASYRLFGGPSGSSTESVAVWGQGVETLLPRVDSVLLAPSDDGVDAAESVQIGWQALSKLIPDRLELVKGTNPVLYRTQGFPSEEELVKIRRAAQGR